MPEEFDSFMWNEYEKNKAILADLMRRHEEVVNHLADVCRRNDRIQEAGNELVQLLHDMTGWAVVNKNHGERIDKLIQQWTEANV